MESTSYLTRRQELFDYFDRHAVEAWAKLTSDAPVSGIRATVRAGRDEMRRTLLSWLPDDLSGTRVLDAGCGTGALAFEAAERGADVTAVDLSPTLVGLAGDRTPETLKGGRVTFQAGDMLDSALGRFDHIVAMDSLIHYRGPDMATAVSNLAARAERSVLFTFAPRTPLLATMHFVGGFFPRSDRAPAIEPIAEARLRKLLMQQPLAQQAVLGRTRRIKSAFYISQAMEVVQQ